MDASTVTLTHEGLSKQAAPLLKLAAAVLGGALAFPANGAVINGDFELGTLAGWSATGNVVVVAASNLLGAGGTGSFPTGIYAAAFGVSDRPATGVLTQSVLTTVGQQYLLSFQYGNFQAVPAGPQSIQAAAIDANSNQLLGSLSVVDSTGAGNLSALLSDYSFQFIATSTTTTLKFSDTSTVTVSTDGILDNVALAVVAAPVPSTLPLALLGLLPMVALQRKDVLPH